MANVLDADVFIRAKNDHYSFETVPGFWTWLKNANANGDVFSIQRVRDELLAGDDDLTEWAKDRHDEFFLPPDPPLLAALSVVATWVTSEPRFTEAAVRTFLDSADYFLVGQAMTRDMIVVTHEVSAPQSRATVKLPDACTAMNVAYMSPFRMLKNENAVFVLS
ncbi:MAG: DUF4411 family protein [Acidimicrobiia bacterium]